MHDSTERSLVDLINQWRKDHPSARICLIAHSAGAGVVLEALSRLDETVVIGSVILLAPDVSPDYRLGPALRHTNVIHVFYSEHDFFWQGGGTLVFGTYDGAHRDGAGRTGFTLADLTDAEKKKVVQHPYQGEWKQYDNGGGHFDWLSGIFASQVLKPLIDQTPLAAQLPVKPAGTGQSAAATHP